MSLVNNSGKVISNNSSTSSVSSSSNSTTKKSSAANSVATIGPGLANNNAAANLNKKAQESISTSSSSEVHFEEEDTPLTPPAISFTTLITDYETELMAFIDNETSRTPSPQPQPDLLIDIQHDEDPHAAAANGNGSGHALPIAEIEKENGLGLGLGLELPKSRALNTNANVEALIDESAKMVINNKNLLLHDLQLQQIQDGDEDELSLMHDYQEYDNSLTSTTTLDTVIAVGDLAPVPAAQAHAGNGNRLDHNNEFNSLEQDESEGEDEDGEQEQEQDEHDSNSNGNNHSSSNGHHYFGEQESSVDDSLTQLQNEEQESESIAAVEAADVGDNNKFHEKQQESVIIKSSSSSKKSSSSTSSSSVVKQSSVEKVQQQGKQVKETIKQSGITAQESITMNLTNGGPANVEATASVNQVKETTRINDEGVVKQKKKNSSQSISVHDADDEFDKPSDCATNNNNAATTKANGSGSGGGSIGNGFHSQHTNIYNNNRNADATRNMNERNRNNSKDYAAPAPAPAPAPQHELDDNEVFNFVSVSKLKSSFTKFDNLARGASDTSIKRVEGKNQAGSPQQESPLDKKPNEHTCKCCGRTIFIMELVRAEKEDWHKHCFRCTICKKSLAVDNYCSNEGILYCKPHFRELFQPKPVLEPNNGEAEEDEETRRKKRAEIIIRESEPVQLPPDVVKSTVDDTSQRFAELEELNKNLDVKSKFQVFQTLAVGQDQEQQPIEPVKRSSSAVLASRVAKYQSAVEAAAKMETGAGVSDADLGLIPPGGIQEENGNEDSDDEAATVKLMTKKLIPADEINFEAVDSVRSKWEQNSFAAKAHKEEARKEEQIRFRSKLLHGKSNQLKEMYEKAVVESTTAPAATSPNPAQLVEEGEVYVAKAKELKEKFESVSDDTPGPRGDGATPTNKAAMLKDEIFESEITKSSRSMFKELDKSASTINFQQQNAMAKSESKTAMARQQQSFDAKDIVRSSDLVEEVVAPSDISNKFQFFEKYTDEQKRQKEQEKKQFRFTPPREGQVKEPSPDVEIYRDPNIVRACDNQVDAPPKTNTASKMLSVFRQLEAAEHQQKQHDSYKPLKEFTPPRETRSAFANGNGTSNGGGDEYDDDSEDEQAHLNNSHGATIEKDEILKQMGSLARASSLRAKFEVWNDTNQDNGDSEDEGEGEGRGHEQQNGNGEVIAPSIDTTKNLRAKFERISELEEMALNNKKEAFNKRPVKRFV